jgi:methyl-accepting chemotaxis protein
VPSIGGIISTVDVLKNAFSDLSGKTVSLTENVTKNGEAVRREFGGLCSSLADVRRDAEESRKLMSASFKQLDDTAENMNKSLDQLSQQCDLLIVGTKKVSDSLEHLKKSTELTNKLIEHVGRLIEDIDRFFAREKV